MTPEEQKRLASVEARLDEQGSDITEIKKDVKSLVGMANRWKGAFFVLLGVGAIVGWFIDRLASFFHK